MDRKFILRSLWHKHFTTNQFYFDRQCDACIYLTKLMLLGDIFITRELTLDEVKHMLQGEMDNESQSVCGVCENDTKIIFLKDIIKMMEE